MAKPSCKVRSLFDENEVSACAKRCSEASCKLSECALSLSCTVRIDQFFNRRSAKGVFGDLS